MPVPEIVAIGAVNLDYIIDSDSIADSRAAVPVPADTTGSIPGFVYGGERSATAEEIGAVLQRLTPLDPVASPGGSGLNTLATIAASGLPVTVGYVGVRGTTPNGEFTFPDWFSSLSIDDRFVAETETSVGVCISYTEGGQRSMLTTDGANASIMDHLASNTEQLVAYLREAKLILVTSFANLETVLPLVELVRRVKAEQPNVILACDPGALWTTPPLPAGVDHLLDEVDWLLVNQREYDAVAERSPGGPRGPSTILVKHADRIEIFSRSNSDGGLKSDLESDLNKPAKQFPNTLVLEDSDIVDDTGTGDAFAAGFLPSLVLDDLSRQDGIELGQRLARAKLAWPGLAGIGTYGAVYRQFRDETSSGPGSIPR